jgi:osmotically-inducible protein OsmY
MSGTKEIRDAVKAELDFDPFVDPTNIIIKNLNGDVALNGTVPSYAEYLAAAAAARRVTGVTSVHNHLEVVLPSGHFRDDASLTTAANNALDFSVMVPDSVEATAIDGNIWLTGTVSCGSQRAASESAVAGLTGVRGIQDDIHVRSYAEIADVSNLVLGALNRNALISDDSDVTVDASDGTVTLSGHVRTWAEHDAVVDAAWMGLGVSSVRDQISVTG